MERKLQINWQSLVEEARRRRKTQRLTQQRLAALAEVSTPTVSRFESGEKNILLASALAILEVLGMVEHVLIDFPDKTERFDPDRDAVLFPARTNDGDIECAISGDALEDHFGALDTGRRACLSAFRTNRCLIEEAAREMFHARRMEQNGYVLIRSRDIRRMFGSMP